MGTANYTDEFTRDVVTQVTVRGDPIKEVSKRLGVGLHSLCASKRKFGKATTDDSDKAAEIRRLRRDMARV